MIQPEKYLILIPITLIILFGWDKEMPEHKKSTKLSLPETSYEYRISSLPEHMTSGTVKSLNNDKATLGRVLFYDKNLSLNNSISCGSCHKQQNGFADPVALSTGLMGKKTKRNSSSIVNAVNKNTFFWDGRADGLEMQVLMPIENHIEMGRRICKNTKRLYCRQ